MRRSPLEAPLPRGTKEARPYLKTTQCSRDATKWKKRRSRRRLNADALQERIDRAANFLPPGQTIRPVRQKEVVVAARAGGFAGTEIPGLTRSVAPNGCDACRRSIGLW